MPNKMLSLLKTPTMSANFISTGKRKIASTLKQAVKAPVTDYMKNMLNTRSNYLDTSVTEGSSSIPRGSGWIGESLFFFTKHAL